MNPVKRLAAPMIFVKPRKGGRTTVWEATCEDCGLVATAGNQHLATRYAAGHSDKSHGSQSMIATYKGKNGKRQMQQSDKRR